MRELAKNFYQIIATVGDGQRLVGHITSKKVDDKYVYDIQFADNIDDSQPLNDCLVETIAESNVTKTSPKADRPEAPTVAIDVKPSDNIREKKSSTSRDVDSDTTEEDFDYNSLKCSEILTNDITDREDTKQPILKKLKKNKVVAKSVFKSPNKIKAKATEFSLNSILTPDSSSRPFRCPWPECCKSFNRKSGLVTHIRTHTGERPFACDWPDCNKRFGQFSVLKNHKRIHTGERPFSCEWQGCGRSFKTNSTLFYHKQQHQRQQTKSEGSAKPKEPNKGKPSVDTSPSSESESDKPMANESHKSTPDMKNSYKCVYEGCGQAFHRRSALLNHINYGHTEQDETEDSDS